MTVASSASTVTSTYRSAPLLLNLEPDGGCGGWRLGSTWCNLGLWDDAASPGCSQSMPFRAACEKLAVAVGDAAGLSRGDAVLDCGVGYADQTAVWATHFSVQSVLAVERSAEHVAAARRAHDEGRLAGADIVELRVGSATDLPAVVAASAAAFAADAPLLFDAVLCLDCAYHFDTRETFLRSAGALLRPGGRFAAADLVVADGDGEQSSLLLRWWRRIARRVVAAVCDIPSDNLHGTARYAASLEAAGMTAVRVEDISSRVLAPFARHAASQRTALRSSISYGESAFLWIIGALFAFVARHRLFAVVLVSARKGEPQAAVMQRD